MKKTFLTLGFALLGAFSALPVFAYTRTPSGLVSESSFNLHIEQSDVCNWGTNNSYIINVTDWNGDASINTFSASSLPIDYVLDYQNTQIQIPSTIYAVKIQGNDDNCFITLEDNGSNYFTITNPPPPAPTIVDNAQSTTEGLFASFWEQLTGPALYIMTGMILVSVIFWGWRKLYKKFVLDK